MWLILVEIELNLIEFRFMKLCELFDFMHLITNVLLVNLIITIVYIYNCDYGIECLTNLIDR